MLSDDRLMGRGTKLQLKCEILRCTATLANIRCDVSSAPMATALSSPYPYALGRCAPAYLRVVVGPKSISKRLADARLGGGCQDWTSDVFGNTPQDLETGERSKAIANGFHHHLHEDLVECR